MTVLGCSKNPNQTSNQPPNRSLSYIRVQNQMGRDLADVTVITNSFGALKSGVISDYQIVGVVHESASVFTTETNGYFRNDRFMGGSNPELPSGKYTYTLKLNANDNIEISLKKD
jgi:hypothetical protein